MTGTSLPILMLQRIHVPSDQRPREFGTLKTFAGGIPFQVPEVTEIPGGRSSFRKSSDRSSPGAHGEASGTQDLFPTCGYCQKDSWFPDQIIILRNKVGKGNSKLIPIMF